MIVSMMELKVRKYSFVSPADLCVTATSATFNLPLPAKNGYLLGVKGRVVTAFSGITGPVHVKIGFNPGGDDLLASSDLGVAAELAGGSGPPRQFYCAARDSLYYPDTPAVITFTSSSGNLEDLTAGQLDIIVLYAVDKT